MQEAPTGTTPCSNSKMLAVSTAAVSALSTMPTHRLPQGTPWACPAIFCLPGRCLPIRIVQKSPEIPSGSCIWHASLCLQDVAHTGICSGHVGKEMPVELLAALPPSLPPHPAAETTWGFDYSSLCPTCFRNCICLNPCLQKPVSCILCPRPLLGLAGLFLGSHSNGSRAQRLKETHGSRRIWPGH